MFRVYVLHISNGGGGGGGDMKKDGTLHTRTKHVSVKHVSTVE